MKTLLITVLLLLTATIGVAQNPVWTLPPNYSYDYVTFPLPSAPTGYGYDGTPAEHVHNSISDATGNLLYFMVDDEIYNKDGYLVGIMESFEYGNVKGYSEIPLLPRESFRVGRS